MTNSKSILLMAKNDDYLDNVYISVLVLESTALKKTPFQMC